MFTQNNPESNEGPEEAFGDIARYCIWQLERGEQGTPHLQGYVALRAQKRITQLTKLFRAHYEVRRGSHDEAKAYASKEDSRVEGPWEFGSEEGIAKKRGQRTDLEGAADLIKEGKTMDEVANEFPVQVIKYHKGLQYYSSLQIHHRSFDTTPQIFVYWGKPGTGKSYTAETRHPGAWWMGKPSQHNAFWFDGYAGEDTIVFDEFYGWLPYDFLMRLMDRYKLALPIKGGYIKCSATNFVFTSIKPWHRWYNTENGSLKRRMREFSQVYHLQTLGAPLVEEDEEEQLSDDGQPPFRHPRTSSL